MTTIVLDANIREFRKSIKRKMELVARSLHVLKDQNSAFALEHKAMILLYADVLCTIDDHAEANGVVLEAAPNGR